MTIYEIDQEIQKIVDMGVHPETGELLFDPEALDELIMERERKIENLALAYKNMLAEARAIKAEEMNLKARREFTEAKAERAREYLDYILAGEKFSTPKVAVSYRKSKKLQLADGFVGWAMENAPDFLRYKDPEPDKTAITNALKAGQEITGAELVESQNMTIK